MPLQIPKVMLDHEFRVVRGVSLFQVDDEGEIDDEYDDGHQ
jgi:hypothetical protein